MPAHMVQFAQVQYEKGRTPVKGNEVIKLRGCPVRKLVPAWLCTWPLEGTWGSLPRPQAPLSPRELHFSEPPAPRRPAPGPDPTSHLTLVDLQPLEARLLEVTRAGLQGESRPWLSVPTCAWPDSDSRPEQTYHVPRA